MPRIIKNAISLPKANISGASDDIIPISLKRNVSPDGLVKCDAKLGTIFRVKPSTMQNAQIKDQNGNLHNKVIIDYFDENGRRLGYIYYELLVIDRIPNKFWGENKKK